MDSHQMNPYALGGGNNFPVVIRPPLRGNSMTASSEMFYQALTTGYPVTILINQPGYPMPANPSVQQPPAYLGLPASPQSAANVPTSAPARITLRDSNNNQLVRWHLEELDRLRREEQERQVPLPNRMLQVQDRQYFGQELRHPVQDQQLPGRDFEAPGQDHRPLDQHFHLPTQEPQQQDRAQEPAPEQESIVKKEPRRRGRPRGSGRGRGSRGTTQTVVRNVPERWTEERQENGVSNKVIAKRGRGRPRGRRAY